MNYKIVGDSCTDLPANMKDDPRITLVPLSFDIDGEIIIDDSTFDQQYFLKRMAESPNVPKSACPSPDAYLNAYADCDEVYAITLSGKLSGSYNSARLAEDMAKEENPNKKIFVFDSLSASIGQTLILLKIMELKDQGKTFEDVVTMVSDFVQNMNTKFVLESLEALRKNGRLSNISALIANTLNIKPVMRAEDGIIYKMGQARGVKAALKLMFEEIKKDVKDPETKILGISHCNNLERAEWIRGELMRDLPFKECVIVDTRGVSTLYASDGGIIVCY